MRLKTKMTENILQPTNDLLRANDVCISISGERVVKSFALQVLQRCNNVGAGL